MITHLGCRGLASQAPRGTETRVPGAGPAGALLCCWPRPSPRGVHTAGSAMQCNASVPHTAGDQLLLNLPALYIKCFRHEDPFPTVSPAQYIATFHLPPSQTEVEESTPASFRRSKTGIKALSNTPHPFRDVNVSQTCLY